MKRISICITSLILIGLIGLCPCWAQSETEPTTEEQKIYKWQINQYKSYPSEFENLIKENSTDLPGPKTEEKIYEWQVGDYQNIVENHAETVKKNLKPREAIEGEDKIYQWQLKDFPEITVGHQDTIRENIEADSPKEDK